MSETRQVAVPRRAAAVLLYRERGGLEFLLALRNTSLRFMGGHHVFPGGSIHVDDRADRVAGCADEDTARSIFAGAREVFEETGLLCTRGALPPREARRAARQRLLASQCGFDAILDEFGLALHAEDFALAGEWITPKWSPIRFHTQYFLYRHNGPCEEEVIEPDGEIVGLDWLSPADARDHWLADRLRLSTPVAFVLRYLAGMPLEEALPWLHRTPGRGDAVPNLYEPRRGIHISPLRTRTLPPNDTTNCVILGESELLVIDPGAHEPEEQAHLKQHIEDMLALGGVVKAIALTHGHPDHCGAAKFLRDAFGAPIWAHRESADEVAFPIGRFLEDGEIIPLGEYPQWRVRCLHTAGHDPGHLCFLEEATRTLIAGDMLANPGTVVISPERGGDMEIYLGELERLLTLDFRFLVPAHGLPIWGSQGKERIRALIAHRHDRERRIRDAVAYGAANIDAIVAYAYQDTPCEQWPLAREQVRAHLARLGLKVGD